MINRRKFMANLGLAAAVPALSNSQTAPGRQSQAGTSGARSRVSLNGQWERRIEGTLYDTICVPSSQHPTGFYQLGGDFLLPRLSRHQRAILHFDAITYYGEASVNGKPLGTLGPYVPYEFEFTPESREGTNRVEVGIADLTPGPDGRGKSALKLGVNPGWEAYGGIIRDVYVEVRPAAFIDNVQFAYNLSPDYSRAECRARVYISSRLRGSGRVEVVLKEGKVEVGRGEKGVQLGEGNSEVEVALEVEAPALWSPEAPNIYELEVRLGSEAGEDRWRTGTGFRETRIEGNEFVLNGERLVLKGVCRHDMWKGEGFTLTAGQQEQDMRMIKELGCNFVRLVHYPHDRRVIELADEVGLLVSEEPGYWGMDFTTMPREMIELGYEIMERTIRRDWNSPSVLAWLLGNECKLTVEYLKEGKERCRKLDPLNRPISFANSMAMEQAKPIFEQAGMDFFDEHIYTYDLDDFTRASRFYGTSRPVTFTEWGGRAIGQSQMVMQHTVDRLIDLTQTKAVAGYSFWSWQDMRQYSRIDEEMHDAVLESGVVTESREPRQVPYMELSRLFEERRSEVKPASTQPLMVPLRSVPWNRHSGFFPIDIQPLVLGVTGRKSWTGFENLMAAFWAKSQMARDQWERTGRRFLLWRGSEIKIAGVPFHVPEVDGYVRPLMLTPEVPEIVVPLNQQGIRLHILGNVTIPEGFPVDGHGGEVAGTYTVHYSSGRNDQISLRNGHEVARANLVYQATRVNPETTSAQRALLFVKDTAREQYQVLLFSHDLRPERAESVTCRLLGRHPLAVFAITLETGLPRERADRGNVG